MEFRGLITQIKLIAIERSTSIGIKPKEPAIERIFCSDEQINQTPLVFRQGGFYYGLSENVEKYFGKNDPTSKTVDTITRGENKTPRKSLKDDHWMYTVSSIIIFATVC